MKTYVNFTRFQILLYYFANFIGLAPFSVRDNMLCPVGFLRKAYAVILAILSSLWIYIALFKHQAQRNEFSSVNRFVSDIVSTLFVGNLWVTLLIFVFKSEKMVAIMNRITAIKDGLKTLGLEDDCGKNCKNFYVKIIATNSVVLFLRKIIESARHDDNRDHGIAFVALFWIGSIMITIHSHSAILIFVETMIRIRKLFESLNHKLQGTDEKRNTSVLRMNRNQLVADQVAHRTITESENIQLSVEDIQMIGRLHSELGDLVESVTEFHAVPILFTIVRHFCILLSNWYWTYTRVFVTHDVLLSIQQLVARTTMTMLELFLIAHACTTMCGEGNATKAILHEVWNKFYPEELRDELTKFSLQLLHKPVAVSAFGFFDLGYSYLYKIFCALVAYFIVMMQFDTSQPNVRT